MAIPRLHLFELEDLPWFPAAIRDLATDYLVFLETTVGLDRAILPVLSELLRASGERRILDLCSGAGGPALAVGEALAGEGLDVKIRLTDLYPNLAAFERARRAAPDRVSFVETPVDARCVPPELSGVRTLFHAFHHFVPDDARRILSDAGAHGRPIAIFDLPDRALRNIFPFLLTPLFVWLGTPFIRPFRWRRLFWTYLVPLVPLTCWWDGLVSHLRSYGAAGLEALAEEVQADGYAWRAGRAPVPGTPGYMTYLVGIPASPAALGATP
jgi:hypothetical protein